MKGNQINSIDDPIGEKRKTPRKVKRRCGVCGKLLSMYNENTYCFVHTMKGFERGAQERERKNRASYLKHLKKMQEDKREK